MIDSPPPEHPASAHHHHDTYSHRNWIISDKRHKRLFAAIFYTFIVPLLFLFCIFLLLNGYLIATLVVCQVRWALGC